MHRYSREEADWSLLYKAGAAVLPSLFVQPAEPSANNGNVPEDGDLWARIDNTVNKNLAALYRYDGEAKRWGLLFNIKSSTSSTVNVSHAILVKEEEVNDIGD